MRSIVLALVLGLGSLAVPAFAQSGGTPLNIRGTVDKLDGETLTVTTREGPKAAIVLPADVRISGVKKITVADIKDGDYIASTSIKGPDGKLRAMEIHTFPPGPPPRNLNQRPYDLAPNSLMTNAQVSQVTKVSQGATTEITVTYEDKKEVVVVSPETAIVAPTSGDKSLLKSGAAVFVAVTKEADGKLTAARVVAETNGIKPPM